MPEYHASHSKNEQNVRRRACNDGDQGASTLNYQAQQASANAVVVDASRGGICAMTSAQVDIIFDTFAAQR
ncbi:MAG: hypothetical protein ACNA8W_21535 [Bradymonadaceae bacterium]